MKIPKTINLLGMNFKIIQKNLDNHDYTGLIDPAKKIITLDKKRPKKEKIGTLMHELGHFYYMYYYDDGREFSANTFGRFVHSIIKQLGGKK